MALLKRDKLIWRDSWAWLHWVLIICSSSSSSSLSHKWVLTLLLRWQMLKYCLRCWNETSCPLLSHAGGLFNAAMKLWSFTFNISHILSHFFTWTQISGERRAGLDQPLGIFPGENIRGTRSRTWWWLYQDMQYLKWHTSQAQQNTFCGVMCHQHVHAKTDLSLWRSAYANVVLKMHVVFIWPHCN